MPKDDDKLTEDQITALAECVIQIKRLIFSPNNSIEEQAAAKNLIRTVDQARKIME